MGGEAFRWPAGTYVHSGKFDHIMMAMETEITKDGIFYKEVEGTPKENAELAESYVHLSKLRDEVISMGIIPGNPSVAYIESAHEISRFLYVIYEEGSDPLIGTPFLSLQFYL